METYTTTTEQKLANAQRRVKKIKGFYIHATVYVFVNLFIIISNGVEGGIDQAFSWNSLATLVFWGIGLCAHGMSVFGTDIIFGKDWEERKIREMMNK